jgi:hypothetical protein
MIQQDRLDEFLRRYEQPVGDGWEYIEGECGELIRNITAKRTTVREQATPVLNEVEKAMSTGFYGS